MATFRALEGIPPPNEINRVATFSRWPLLPARNGKDIEMETDPLFRKMQALLSLADVTINGDRPWDIRVHNRDLFPRILSRGSLGLGEAYMDGWWDCERIDEFICRVFKAQLNSKINPWRECFPYLKSRIRNLQKPACSSAICRHHYDIGNDLYLGMLDGRQIYSCGYWEHASSLDEAQEAKLDLVCRKLRLQPGMRVLDIGCGWGGTAKYMAEEYQVEVVGITLSRNQATYARGICSGLSVEIRLEDYRSVRDEFDRIVSIGMIEHVGYKNYRRYMKTVSRCLKENGLFLLQTIGGNTSVRKTDPWISKYIFPNSMLPSAEQLTRAMEPLFVLEDWHNFGPDYDRTLMHWYENFQANWGTIREKYGERFYRMWKFYLLSCAGSFRARVNQLWQIVLSPKGSAPDHYVAPR